MRAPEKFFCRNCLDDVFYIAQLDDNGVCKRCGEERTRYLGDKLSAEEMVERLQRIARDSMARVSGAELTVKKYTERLHKATAALDRYFNGEPAEGSRHDHSTI